MQRPIQPSAAPPILTFYRGGLNLGLFQPGPPVYPQGSEVFGNQSGGDPTTYRTQSLGPGEKLFGWLLILSGNDSKIVFRGQNEPINNQVYSDYDGLYNKNELKSVGKKITNSYKNGNYKDWYVPSRDELAFISKNLPKNFTLDFRFASFQSKRYISSTYVKNQPGKETFLYAQSFNEPTYGVTSFVSDEASMFVRYVRRVPVYII
jgi:hypothetical protein